MKRAVLITGATGKQGGAVIDALLASPQAEDFTILALTRDSKSNAANQLKDRGVKLIQGDLNNASSIFETTEVAEQPIWGLFSVQSAPGGEHDLGGAPTQFGKGSTAKEEEKLGKDLIDAAIANKVEFFVYASVDRGGEKSWDVKTPIAHFSTKHTIEHYLREKAENMKWAILRPVTFMDNLTPDFNGSAWATMWKLVVKDKPLHLVAVSDVGKLSADAFVKPDEYQGKSISIAGDELLFVDANKIFREKTGKDIPTIATPLAYGVMLLVSELRTMFKWFNNDGYEVDIEKLKEEHPGLLKWGDWIEKESAFKRPNQPDQSE